MSAELYYIAGAYALMSAVIEMGNGRWTTAGTMGTAAMGIGIGMGIPAPIVAGAVVTGASFGDKLSPLSDKFLN